MTDREILFEIQPFGNVLRVIAVDAATGIEVTIVGDPRMNTRDLQALARRKLDYVMAKQEKPR